MTINEIQNKENSIELSVPNFIYNNFHKFSNSNINDNSVIEVLTNGERFRIPISYTGKQAELGVWLGEIPQSVISSISKKVFADHRKIEKIVYLNSLVEYENATTNNHFRIVLPNSVEELKGRLSSKGRYNARRENRILKEQFPDLTQNTYSVDEYPDSVFLEYFKMKKTTHGTNYNMTAEEYIQKYHVSNIYSLSAGDKILAIILSCEQCPIVYIENLTYDVEYAKFSPGKVLYDSYLEILINKGFSELYLAGGNLDYKKRYGSIEDTVYSGIIYRNSKVKKHEMKQKQKQDKISEIYTNLPETVKNIYRSIKGILK